MKRLEFETISKFTNKLIEIYENELSEHDVSVYGDYDFIKCVLENLIVSGYHIGNEIELEDYEISNYDKEFVLYLSSDGISVEKAWYEEGSEYFYSESNVSFVHDECNSKLLKFVESDFIFEIGVGDNGEDNDSSENKDYGKDTYSVKVRANLDASDALKIITNMERRISRMSDNLMEMDRFCRLLGW